MYTNRLACIFYVRYSPHPYTRHFNTLKCSLKITFPQPLLATISRFRCIYHCLHSNLYSTNTVQPASTTCGSQVDGFVASPPRHCVYVEEQKRKYTCNPTIIVLIFLTVYRRTRVYRNAHRNKPALCSYFTNASPDKTVSFS